MDGSILVLRFKADAGARYTLHEEETLNSDWQVHQVLDSLVPGPVEVRVPIDPAVDRRFYRLVIE